MKTDGLWYESEAGPQGVQKHIVCEKSLPSEYPLFFELFVEGGGGKFTQYTQCIGSKLVGCELVFHSPIIEKPYNSWHAC